MLQYCSVFTENNEILPECPQSAPINTLCYISSDYLDITKAIRQVNRSSAPGPDGIHSKFITKIYTHLIQPLKRFFNVMVSTGAVLDSRKSIEVIPIYKKNTKPNNSVSYRPVSLASCASKVLEKINSCQAPTASTQVLNYI